MSYNGNEWFIRQASPETVRIDIYPHPLATSTSAVKTITVKGKLTISEKVVRGTIMDNDATANWLIS